MSDSQPGLDVDGMLERFKERALAVKQRPLPPVAGDERCNYCPARDNYNYSWG